MTSGQANVSPEYTGTGWINYLGNENPVKGEEAQYLAVKDADAKNGLSWLPPAPMDDTYAFAIRESEAQRLGISKLSDLTKLSKADLTFCVESEFANRNDGFVPMLKTYGLTREQLGRVDEPGHRRHLHGDRGRPVQLRRGVHHRRTHPRPQAAGPRRRQGVLPALQPLSGGATPTCSPNIPSWPRYSGS